MAGYKRSHNLVSRNWGRYCVPELGHANWRFHVMDVRGRKVNPGKADETKATAKQGEGRTVVVRTMGSMAVPRALHRI